jgi:hypothetical protein
VHSPKPDLRQGKRHMGGGAFTHGARALHAQTLPRERQRTNTRSTVKHSSTTVVSENLVRVFAPRVSATFAELGTLGMVVRISSMTNAGYLTTARPH